MWPSKLKFSSSMLIGAALFTLMFHVSMIKLHTVWKRFLHHVPGAVMLPQCIMINETHCRCTCMHTWVASADAACWLQRTAGRTGVFAYR